MKNNYKFLDNINFPSDLRKVSENDLQQVATCCKSFSETFLKSDGKLILSKNL